jgi:hypothetical protein
MSTITTGDRTRMKRKTESWAPYGLVTLAALLASTWAAALDNHDHATAAFAWLSGCSAAAAQWRDANVHGWLPTRDAVVGARCSIAACRSGRAAGGVRDATALVTAREPRVRTAVDDRIRSC